MRRIPGHHGSSFGTRRERIKVNTITSDGKDAALTNIDFSKGPAEGFGSLKDILLGDIPVIYLDQKGRFRHPIQ